MDGQPAWRGCQRLRWSEAMLDLGKTGNAAAGVAVVVVVVVVVVLIVAVVAEEDLVM